MFFRKFSIAALCFLSFFASQFSVAQVSAFFKTSDGIGIHYLEAGSGRPIVFIPGWTMPAGIWQKQIDEFSTKYHVIAIDPRSQGESDKQPSGHLPETRARDYKELVDQLGLEQPVLVGWSMACGEMMKYVESYGTGDVGCGPGGRPSMEQTSSGDVHQRGRMDEPTPAGPSETNRRLRTKDVSQAATGRLPEARN
jgi:pimeloyl-ACP methyl ester carboxylesterase